jgi:hypothetical protein
MILITSYYKPNNSERKKEIDKCLINNFNNKYISNIVLLNNKIYDIHFINDKYNKIKQEVINDNEDYKLLFSDAIDYINKNFKDRICILSNSDIYFDNSLCKINNKNINNRLFALLRYDEDEFNKKNLFKLYDNPRRDAQDCWIFRSPLKIDINKLNFSFGTLGCDNIFAKLIYDSGLFIINPCYDIITTHVHNTNFRTYTENDRLHGIYCLLEPCKINDLPKPEFIQF